MATINLDLRSTITLGDSGFITTQVSDDILEVITEGLSTPQTSPVAPTTADTTAADDSTTEPASSTGNYRHITGGTQLLY